MKKQLTVAERTECIRLAIQTNALRVVDTAASYAEFIATDAIDAIVPNSAFVHLDCLKTALKATQRQDSEGTHVVDVDKLIAAAQKIYESTPSSCKNAGVQTEPLSS